MTKLEKIRELLEQSADHIDEHGHHQNDMWEGKSCCIMGAPRMIDGESSYSHIIRSALAHIGYDEKWNDKPGRTKQEVVDALRNAATVVDEKVLEQVYGPRWAAITDLIIDVDNWGPQEYTEIQTATGAEDFKTVVQPDKFYIVSLAGFMATVMTSGLTSNSVPFKNYFDNKYRSL